MTFNGAVLENPVNKQIENLTYCSRLNHLESLQQGKFMKAWKGSNEKFSKFVFNEKSKIPSYKLDNLRRVNYGLAPIPVNLYGWGIAYDDHCKHCPGEKGTLEHLLLHCRHLKEKRLALLSKVTKLLEKIDSNIYRIDNRKWCFFNDFSNEKLKDILKVSTQKVKKVIEKMMLLIVTDGLNMIFEDSRKFFEQVNEELFY